VATVCQSGQCVGLGQGPQALIGAFQLRQPLLYQSVQRTRVAQNPPKAATHPQHRRADAEQHCQQPKGMAEPQGLVVDLQWPATRKRLGMAVALTERLQFIATGRQCEQGHVRAVQFRDGCLSCVNKSTACAQIGGCIDAQLERLSGAQIQRGRVRHARRGDAGWLPPELGLRGDRVRRCRDQ